ncbi:MULTISPECIES: PLD nuclease N-terminal domain-containing protein [Cryobacterium]|uniref:PLDc_N domain-containing protein n=1 Tax=Cryobacterium mannosilyticum TaxID=1259190 RepID=A0A4R8WEU5_9MICO|nr:MULTISPECIES: PLD nuclease N-terminal domain-containing protein [Cryobacterium]TFB92493.1 PLDc_N domain-containing protein [Cryobacterium sp. HLT2-28]TFC06018.1 PLDc_N domain-containing protein [Cryobacterium mannosilyticum]
MYMLISAVFFLLLLGALIDIITRQDGQVQHLPKLVWIMIVILLPVIGSILWFAVGREYAAPIDRGTFGDPRRSQARPSRPGEPRPGEPSRGKYTGVPSRSTEDELADLEREIEFHAEAARIRNLEAEIEARRKSLE